MNIINKLQEIAKSNPAGFTVSIDTLKAVNTGYIVAMAETQNCFGLKGLKKAFEVAQSKTGIIGGWKEGKKFYFNAVMQFEYKAEAIKAGRENGQIAIFDFNTLQVIYL